MITVSFVVSVYYMCPLLCLSSPVHDKIAVLIYVLLQYILSSVYFICDVALIAWVSHSLNGGHAREFIQHTSRYGASNKQ